MKYEPVFDKLQGSCLAYSNNTDIRYLSTAGGYISTLIKYLFDTNEISTSVTFERDGYTFSPKLIYSYEKYNNIGSLYQEIDMVSFLKKNINKIKGKIAITLLPCQVNAIRSLAKQNNLEVFIISLVCSAQMNLSCTQQYLKLIDVDVDEIENFRYRGKGWPTYISIQLKNGSVVEEKQLWNQMFHSYFFHEKRCLKCTDTFGVKSDLAVSDPWRIKSMKDDKIGKSIVYFFNDYAQEIHNSLLKSAYVYSDTISNHSAINSQLGTLQKKYFIRNSKFFRSIIKIMNQSFYRTLILKHRYFLFLHSKVINKVLHIIISKNKKVN